MCFTLGEKEMNRTIVIITVAALVSLIIWILAGRGDKKLDGGTLPSSATRALTDERAAGDHAPTKSVRATRNVPVVELGQDVTSEYFRASIPADWEKAEVTPPNMLRYSSPLALEGRPLLFQLLTTPASGKGLNELRTSMEKSNETLVARLQEHIGTATTGRKVFEEEDVSFPSLNLINLGGEDVLRSESLSVETSQSKSTVRSTITYTRLVGDKYAIVMISGPLDLFRDYIAEITAIERTIEAQQAVDGNPH